MTKMLCLFAMCCALAACAADQPSDSAARSQISTGSRLPGAPDPGLHSFGQDPMDHVAPPNQALMMDKAWPLVMGPH
jgi:hypothetical protein